MPHPVIELVNVSRRFSTGSGQTVDALVDVTFDIERGSSVALLGRNGAGKSTLAKILATMLLPSSGRAIVDGHDVVREPRAARRHLSVMFGGDRGLYGLLSARENLRYFGMLAGVRASDVRRRVPALLEQVGLEASADRRVEGFSKGMRQRLHVAIALISEPRVLVLDEPTVGLDPTEARRLRDHVLSLRERDVTVLLTSHMLLDVERLSDRVIMIGEGRILHDLTVTQFARTTGYAAVVRVTTAGRPRDEVLARWREGGLTQVGSDGDDSVFELRVDRWDADVLRRLSDRLSGAEVRDIDIRHSSLDEAFALISGDGQVGGAPGLERVRP